jgi:hypothetical protein
MSAEIISDATPISIPQSNEPLSDAASFRTGRGHLIQLPAYSPGAAPVLLEQTSGFRILAQRIFPLLNPHGPDAALKTRIQIKVSSGNATVYRQNYCAEDVSLTEAVALAKKWIGRRRFQDRAEFIFLSPLLPLWALSAALAWFLAPILKNLKNSQLYLYCSRSSGFLGQLDLLRH